MTTLSDYGFNPASKSELDHWVEPTLQSCLVAYLLGQYIPVNDITSSDVKKIEFLIPPMNDYMDIGTMRIVVKFKVVNGAAGGEKDLVEADKVFPLQYFLNTMWNNIEIYLGSIKITPQTNTYYLRAFFDALLYSSEGAKKTFLESSMWTSTKEERLERIKLSKSCTLVGEIHPDITQQHKFLIPGVPMRIVFHRNPDDILFSVDSASAAVKPKMKIQSMKLLIRKFTPVDDNKNGMESTLIHKPIRYYFTRNEVEVKHIPSGVTRHTVIDVCKNRIPRILIVGLISNKTLSGDYATDGLTFAPNNVKMVCATRSHQMIVGIPYTPDYENDEFDFEYNEFYCALGQNTNDPLMRISREDFKTRLSLYAFNMTGDFSNVGIESGTFNDPGLGDVKLDFEFTKATTESLNVVDYQQYDSWVELDVHRIAKTNY